MAGLDLSSFERRNQGARGFELCGLTLDIELRTQARVGSNLGEVQRILLQSDVLVRDLQSALKAAQFRIIACDLRQQTKEHVAPRFCDCAYVRRSGLQSPAASAKEVDLPACIESQLEDVRLKRRQQAGAS